VLAHTWCLFTPCACSHLVLGHTLCMPTLCMAAPPCAWSHHLVLGHTWCLFTPCACSNLVLGHTLCVPTLCMPAPPCAWSHHLVLGHTWCLVTPPGACSHLVRAYRVLARTTWCLVTPPCAWSHLVLGHTTLCWVTPCACLPCACPHHLVLGHTTLCLVTPCAWSHLVLGHTTWCLVTPCAGSHLVRAYLVLAHTTWCLVTPCAETACSLTHTTLLPAQSIFMLAPIAPFFLLPMPTACYTFQLNHFPVHSQPALAEVPNTCWGMGMEALFMVHGGMQWGGLLFTQCMCCKAELLARRQKGVNQVGQEMGTTSNANVAHMAAHCAPLCVQGRRTTRWTTEGR